jgi:integrase
LEKRKLEIEIFEFKENPKLCPINCLSSYLTRTEGFCSDQDGLFLTLSKPHRLSRPNTLAKHLKRVLGAAGVDTNQFSAHSFRSASTSKALAVGVSIEDILARATWSSSSTFCKFYAREITEGKAFSEATLRFAL